MSRRSFPIAAVLLGFASLLGFGSPFARGEILSGAKLTSSERRFYLTKFSKPGGYSGNLAWVIKQIADSGDREEYDLLSAAMAGIVATDPVAARAVFDAGFSMEGVPVQEFPRGTFPGDLRTPSELRAVRDAVFRFVHQTFTSPDSPGVFSLQILRLLEPELVALGTADQETLMDDLAVDFAEKTSNVLGPDFYKSLLAKVAEDAVRPYFGLAAGDVSELTWTAQDSDPEGIFPYLLGSSSFHWTTPEGTELYSETAGFGIHVLALPEVSVAALLARQAEADQIGIYSWRVGRRDLSRFLNLNIRRAAVKTVGSESAPRYSAMGGVGGMTGLVMASDNLGSAAVPLIDRYAAFYARRGFSFTRSTAVTGLKAFVLGKIMSGEIQYLVKEAHAAGDEQNLVWLSRRGEVLTGTRNMNGKSEKVFLMRPDPTSGEDYISNRAFGDAVHGRKVPLVYFNTSCWSSQKAPGEISAADSPLFTEIPVTQEARMLYDSPDSAIRILLDDLRSGRTYAEMRGDLRAVPGYASGSEDTYIFPDEPRYRKTLDHLGSAFARDVEVVTPVALTLDETLPKMIRSSIPEIPTPAFRPIRSHSSNRVEK
jgi:hypothetical protein